MTKQNKNTSRKEGLRQINLSLPLNSIIFAAILFQWSLLPIALGNENDSPLHPECQQSFIQKVRALFPEKNSNLVSLPSSLPSIQSISKIPPKLQTPHETLFWNTYFNLPEEVQTYFLQTPTEINAFNRHFENLQKKTNSMSEIPLFTENIRKVFYDELYSPVSKATQTKLINAKQFFHHLVSEKQQLNESQTSLATISFQKKREENNIHTIVSYLWNNDYIQTISPTRLNGSNVSYEIRNNLVIGQKSNKNLILIVPREQIKIPAWNPLDTEYLIKISHSPLSNFLKDIFQTQSPLPAVLGHDGYFYLFDGNHRFAISSRKTFALKLNYPLQTTTLRSYYDLINKKQPSTEDLILHYGLKDLNLSEPLHLPLNRFLNLPSSPVIPLKFE